MGMGGDTAPPHQTLGGTGAASGMLIQPVIGQESQGVGGLDKERTGCDFRVWVLDGCLSRAPP